MCSVTFAQRIQDSISHIAAGHSGGQGLGGAEEALRAIVERGDEAERKLARSFLERIESIRNSPSVVYAVELSDLGERLVCDQRSPYYHYYWNPQSPLPAVSEINPSRLIAQLYLD